MSLTAAWTKTFMKYINIYAYIRKKNDMILNMAKFTKLQELLQLMNNGDRNTFTSNKMLQSIGNRLLIDVMS